MNKTSHFEFVINRFISKFIRAAFSFSPLSPQSGLLHVVHVYLTELFFVIHFIGIYSVKVFILATDLSLGWPTVQIASEDSYISLKDTTYTKGIQCKMAPVCTRYHYTALQLTRCILPCIHVLHCAVQHPHGRKQQAQHGLGVDW